MKTVLGTLALLLTTGAPGADRLKWAGEQKLIARDKAFEAFQGEFKKELAPMVTGLRILIGPDKDGDDVQAVLMFEYVDDKVEKKFNIPCHTHDKKDINDIDCHLAKK
jgi:hypothetical protein